MWLNWYQRKLIMTNIATAFYVFVAVLMTLHIGSVQSACSEDQVASCHSNISALYLQAASTENQFDSYCSQVSSTCQSTLTECSCVNGSSLQQCLEFIGIKEGIEYMCEAGNRGGYSNNAKCIIENTEELKQFCTNTNPTCSGYNDAFQCFYYGMEMLCNKETAELMWEFVLRKYKPQYDSINCTISHIGTSVLPSCSSGQSAECRRIVDGLYKRAPTTEIQFDPYCSWVNSTCQSSLTNCSCVNESLLQQCHEFIGIKEGIEYMCQAGNRRAYRDNVNCIIDNTDVLKQFCANTKTDCDGYNDAIRCFYYGMKTLCNEETAELMWEFLRRKYKRQVDSINCTISPIGSSVQPSCSEEQVIGCRRIIIGVYERAPTTEIQFDPYCSWVSSTCQSTLTKCDCLSGFPLQLCREFIGIKDGIEYMCKQENRNGYRDNVECILENTYELERICNVNKLQNCSSYNNAFKCFYDGMKKECNEEAAKLMWEFELRKYKPQHDSISCQITNDPTDHAPMVSGALWLTLSIALATVFMTTG